jgi:hypothetical protein
VTCSANADWARGVPPRIPDVTEPILESVDDVLPHLDELVADG